MMLAVIGLCLHHLNAVCCWAGNQELNEPVENQIVTLVIQDHPSLKGTLRELSWYSLTI